MPNKLNSTIINTIKEYYLEKKDILLTPSEMAREFKKQYPNVERSQSILRKNYFRPLFKDLDPENNIDKHPNANIDETIVEETGNNKFINYKGEKSITSLEEAVKFFEIDLEVWDVESWKCKSWDTSMNIKEVDAKGRPFSKPVKRTNYAVNVILKKKEKEVDYEKITTNLDKLYKSYPSIIKSLGNGIGVVTIADLHIGLKVNKNGHIINTPEFDSNSVVKYLSEVAARTNALGYKEIHLVILGDLVESVSGYNHIETLKEMESTITGGNIIILAYEIISKFIAKIKNLKKVYMISGNHDRLTPDKAMDKDGGACQLVAYMLKKTVDVEWHPFLISKVIDNVNYILTHGHLKITNQDLGKIFFEYGKQDMYNVMLSGHWHIRRSTKVFPEKNLILADTSGYRAITVPPIVSGTRWTEENGWSCAPGFIISEANSSKSNINLFDFALN